jgi:hypothetical protein
MFRRCLLMFRLVTLNHPSNQKDTSNNNSPTPKDAKTYRLCFDTSYYPEAHLLVLTFISRLCNSNLSPLQPKRYSTTHRLPNGKKKKQKGKNSTLTRVGFEPTHISVVEIQAGLKSTALDHSAIVSRMEKLEKFWGRNVYIARKTTYDRSSGGE